MNRELNKVFANLAEDIQFQAWNAARADFPRFIYVCEFGTVWKLTPRDWWRFVIKTIRNNGSYELPLSQALHNRPRHINAGQDGVFYSSDDTVRCVDPRDWTVEDWENELRMAEPAMA